jgi:ABC-2 type transport system permease protein
MSITPLLLRPQQLSLKNRLLAGGWQSLKETFGIVVSLGMMAAMYLCTRAALDATKELPVAAAIDPMGPLSMLLSSLFAMLMLASAISSIGSFFLARDLDLLLSSPLSLGRFLGGRCAEVAISTGWMVCVFGFPCLVALGQFFGCGTSFFLLAPLASLAWVAMAVLSGALSALIFAAVAPPRQGKALLLVLFMASLAAFFASLNSAPLSLAAAGHPVEAHLAILDRAAHATWSPGYYWARIIVCLKEGQLFAGSALLGGALAAALALWGAIWGIAKASYSQAYGRLRGEASSMHLNSRASQSIARFIFPFLRSDRRALITKEYKVFSRDITHIIQLGMLLAICFIYLSNFHSLQSPPDATPEVQLLWQILLLLVNVGLSFLVVTCICSRFVFPSLSLEGTSFWILQSAPISMRNILRAKVLSWFLPLSVISSVVFLSGAMAVGAEEPLVLASGCIGFILCYGLVGMSIGFGALFAHFEWDYSSQVSTNMGSFIFMAVSFLSLAINLIPVALMFGTYAFMPSLFPHPASQTLILALGLLALALLNWACAAASLSLGSRSLKAH